MNPFRAIIMLTGSLALAACTMPNPYSSGQAPVKSTGPSPTQPSQPTPPMVKPPVIEMPAAPPSPITEVRSENLAYLVDGLANKLKAVQRLMKFKDRYYSITSVIKRVVRLTLMA